ncbi:MULTISPECIES: hypothetical protein [unclassified Pseudomonas]|uniref:hypothetical protein n=1 Tax=unclassified Pseudomonas TaxID=196821 RepID=UPI00128E34DB|nr:MULTISPECIES: hypothetical protein [unclassified Pseudomonas]MPQ68537.1 hypothetical protein [Pseudomonas sp. MWU12-2323]
MTGEITRIKALAKPNDGEHWLIGSNENTPVLSVKPLSQPTATDHGDSSGVAQLGLGRLSPLLQAIPNLITTSVAKSNQYFRVEINGPLAATRDGNGLRAFSRSADGKFTEHARLFQDSNLTNLVSSAALFQIASAVVAQQHLADISAKLSDILAGVERIEQFQQNKRESQITGSIEYLRQIAPALLNGQHNNSVHAQLEAQEVQLGQIQKHLKLELDDITKSIRTLNISTTLGTKKLKEALEKTLDRFSHSLEQSQLCLAARMVACRLLDTFPGEVQWVQVRLDDLNRVADSFEGEQGVVEQFRNAYKERTNKMSALTESNSELNARRQSLLKAQEKRLLKLTTDSAGRLREISQAVLDTRKVILELKMQGNECVGVARLPS